MTGAPPWSSPVRFPDAGAAEQTFNLSADAAQRAAIAKTLGLPSLQRLDARVRLRPWLDGAELRGDWSADVTYACGVSLEDFDAALKGDFTVRIVPAGSPHAPASDLEISVDPDQPDPPDVSESATIDLAAYVTEHLALEIDPFPRKPGVEFTPPEGARESSPFDILARLKPGEPQGD